MADEKEGNQWLIKLNQKIPPKFKLTLYPLDSPPYLTASVFSFPSLSCENSNAAPPRTSDYSLVGTPAPTSLIWISLHKHYTTFSAQMDRLAIAAFSLLHNVGIFSRSLPSPSSPLPPPLLPWLVPLVLDSSNWVAAWTRDGDQKYAVHGGACFGLCWELSDCHNSSSECYYYER